MNTIQARAQTLTVVVLVGLVASLWYYPWLDAHRWTGAGTEPKSELVVTNAANSGPGTLREAVFAATRADAPVMIVLRTREIVLETPLPPVITRFGLTIRSPGERSVVVAPPTYALPVFDVRAGRVALENLEIRSAPAQAIGIASREPVIVRNVAVSDADVAIGAAGAYQLEVEGADLSGNRVGIELLGVGTSVISDTTFSRHDEAGLWVVGLVDRTSGTPEVEVAGSRFFGARYGIVAANASMRIHDSAISGFDGDGVLLLGGVANVSGNQVWEGAGAAVRSVGVADARIIGNELHENTTMGLLLQGSGSVRAEDNNVYRNGYGIVAVQNRNPASVTLTSNVLIGQNIDGVVAVGDSPVIAQNRVLRNGSAGIRVYDLVLPDAYVQSEPFLDGNILEDNLLNEPVYGEYRMPGSTGQ